MVARHLRAVASRFPLALLGLVCVTAVVFGSANGLAFGNPKLAIRLITALGTGVVLAVAGSLFREARQTSLLCLPLAWLLPSAATISLLVLPGTLVHPLLALGAAVLWLSVAATTGNKGQESVFVRLNRAAVWEGILALLFIGIAAAGVLAIEAALSTLFHLFRGHGLINYCFPVLFGLIGPGFWLCRLPRLEALRSGGGASDMLSRSVGLIGAWAVTPILFAYAAILIAYMGQMLLVRALPSNRIGWMVLCLLLAGAANWLLLAEEEDRGHIRFFRRYWFWLTLPPLALLLHAALIRVDAYGITPNRMILMAGAVWGTVLALCYLAGRGDLRLIPAFGAAALLFIAIGPFNLDAVSARNQADRLSRILDAAGVDGLSSARRLTLEENNVALAAMTHLFFARDMRPMLDAVLAAHGVVLAAEQAPYDLIKAWGYTGSREGMAARPGEVITSYLQAWLEELAPLDVAATPVFLGEFDLPRKGLKPAGAMGIGFDGQDLLIGERFVRAVAARRISIEAWLHQESGSALSGKTIGFTHAGNRYVALPTAVLANRFEADGTSRFELERLTVLLFVSK